MRDLPFDVYQRQKSDNVRELLEEKLGSLKDIWQPPIFIKDGTRRRAAFAFCFDAKKQKLSFGFNAIKSNTIIDVENCLMLAQNILSLLPAFRACLSELCRVVYRIKNKAKKYSLLQITSGDFLVLKADNGIDVVLETPTELCLEHRLVIADFMENTPDVIRFSWRKKHADKAEPIVEKTQPFIKIEQTNVFISSGDFLQPSKEGEDALLTLAKDYLGATRGKIADLFCGIGTFSYALAEMKGNSITSVDVSPTLLNGLKRSINQNMITNVTVKEQNLFLYPLTQDELIGFDAIVFDPPRAGALETVKELVKVKPDKRPQKIISISCFPATFMRDAKVLCDGGYHLKKVTMIDQFVYSNHSEIVALFTNEK